MYKISSFLEMLGIVLSRAQSKKALVKEHTILIATY